MGEQINVLIADDHAILRDGLKSALQTDADIEIIGEAENGIDAVKLANELKPDIILMDINMPKQNGIESAREIKNSHPEIKIILLTMYDNRQYILDAFSSNIDGYILKMARLKDVIKAIKAVNAGDAYFDKDVTEIIKQHKEYLSSFRVTKIPNPELTKRENEIIELVAKGYTAGEISETLSISYSTVKNHRHNILKKLGLKNSVEIVRYAIETGIIK